MNRDTLDKAKLLDTTIGSLESIISTLSMEDCNRFRTELLGYSLINVCNKEEFKKDLISFFQKILDDAKYEFEML